MTTRHDTPALVDLRNPENLPAFVYKLHKAIAANPDIDTEKTRQQLSHEIAVALGARSLEAYQKTKPATPAPLTPDEKSLIDSMTEADSKRWAQRALSWYVLRSADHRYLHGSDDEPYHLLRATDCTPELLVLSKEDAQALARSADSHLPDELKGCQLVAEPLSQSIPDLFAALSMDAEALRNLCEKFAIDDHTWTALPYLGLSREQWQYQALQGDTQAGYWDWVVSELEQAADIMEDNVHPR